MDRSAISRRPEVLATNFQSILYHGTMPEDKERSMQPPVFFIDLNLDQIVDAVVKGREEYGLKPSFYSPVRDLEDVRYRQAVLRDLEDSGLSARIADFAERMRRMRRRLPDKDKSYYKYQRERFFLEAVQLYCDAALGLEKDLAVLDFRSPGLWAFRDFLDDYLIGPGFTRMLSETKDLLEELTDLEYGVYMRDLEVQVRRRGPEIDYTLEIERLFGKFRRERTAPVYVGKAREPDSPDDMNHIEGRILEGVATLFPELFQRLDAFCERWKDFAEAKVIAFDREIQFYLAYKEYIAPLKETGLAFCFPEVSDKDKAVYDETGFDLALARKLNGEKRPIVCNDLALSGGERIIVVTGPNQGGKTTFSRTFGQLHYLAALGLTVPGTRAKLFLFDKLFTHFERAEHATDLRSKLEDDLVRLHEILTQATPRSIVVLNEILSSATLQDAVYLSGKIMERIDALDALCVWVTFIDEIIGKSSKTVSMVSAMEPDNLTVRTFRIVRKAADGLAYALAIAQKYRVTYQELKKRLPS